MIWLVVLLVVGLAVLGLPRFRGGQVPPVGGLAPDFMLPAQDGTSVSLAAQRGKWVVLYFYPKDKTPG